MVKITLNDQGKKKIVDVDLWSLVKANILSSLVIWGILYGILLIILFFIFLFFGLAALTIF